MRFKHKSTRFRNSVFVRCYVCQYEWYYTGKPTKHGFATCPRCWKSIKVDKWREYAQEKETCAIQRNFHSSVSLEDRLRLILFNTSEIEKKQNNYWKWYRF